MLFLSHLTAAWNVRRSSANEQTNRKPLSRELPAHSEWQGVGYVLGFRSLGSLGSLGSEPFKHHGGFDVQAFDTLYTAKPRDLSREQAPNALNTMNPKPSTLKTSRLSNTYPLSPPT